jgi:hypothetical protein
MRILLIFICFFSLSSRATDDQSIQELFKKYDSVMDKKKIELIDDVFSKKFIKESGGKQELIEKIKGLKESLTENKSQLSWQKTPKPNQFLVRIKETSIDKKKNIPPVTEYVVIKEEGKLKIDGTVGDAE